MMLIRIAKAKWIYVSLLPTLALLCVFMLYPAINAAIRSFYYWNFDNLRNSRFVGLDNYKALSADKEFWRSFLNLLIFIVTGFLKTFFVTVPVTYLVFKLGGSRSGKAFQRLYVIPMVIPGVVMILFWKFFFEYNFGIFNTVLRLLGMDRFTHVWLGEKPTALPALIFMGFPWVVGLGFLILLAGFQGIDESIHESAKIDGANTRQLYWKIDIPLIMPQLKLLILLGMIGGIQQYESQLIMTGGGPDGTTMVPGLYMYQTAFDAGNLGYGSTMGILLFFVTLIVTIINNKYINRG